MARLSRRRCIVVMLMIIMLSACSREVVKEPVDEVTLQLAWKHQAQFAGFYAADLKGFYEDENLKVTLRPQLKPSSDIVDMLVEGDVDFALNSGIGLLLARSKGQPVTAIASIHQHYPLAFISLQDKEIKHPLDFVGKRFRSLPPGGGAIILDMLLENNNIDKNDLVFVQSDYDLNRLFSGEIDVWSGYTFNEVLVAGERGIAINQIRPEEFGVNMLGDTLCTSNLLINTNPDLVLRFVRASLRGWQWAVAHPDEAAKMALHFDNTLSPEHQTGMMKASIPYIQGKLPLGMMSAESWQEMLEAVLEQGVIGNPINLNTVYTNSFVERTYEKQ